MVTNVRSSSPISFSRLQALCRDGFTAVESDYAGIAPSTSTLHSKVLAYEYTEVSHKSFSIRVFRLDTKDHRPVNVDLYILTLVGSGASLIGPIKPSSGHHLEDLPPSVWTSLPAGNTDSLHFLAASSTTLISSSVSP